MDALSARVDAHFTIIADLPEWFFRDSLAGSYTLYPVQTDVGLVQHSALDIDLPATVSRLAGFYPFAWKTLEDCAAAFSDCDLVISDIAPLGIAAAGESGIPAVLLENFTWDWIYESYRADYPEISLSIAYISDMYRKADYRIQAEPVCCRHDCDLLTAPIARKVRNSRQETRNKLQVQEDEKLVLVSLGGEGIKALPFSELENCRNTVFLVSGLQGHVSTQGNVRILPDNSDFFHPDLVAAVDAVIGKVGYSTLAEVYHAGTPFGYIERTDFRESEPLVYFIRQHMNGAAISAEDFLNGSWIKALPQLYSLQNSRVDRLNGADQCAEFLSSLLHSFKKKCDG